MRLAVFLIGVAVGLAGVLFAVRPGAARRTIRFFGKGRMIYAGAVTKGVFGVLLLIAATGCERPWLVITVGLVSLLAGVSLAAARTGLVGRSLAWWSDRRDWQYRFLGIGAALMGVLIAYAAGLPR